MPQQTNSAIRRSLNQIDDNLAGQKLRVAGRVLAYDVETGLIILIDKQHGLLVDVELILQDESTAWATERLSTITTIGHLERSSTPLVIPAVPLNAPRLQINRGLVLRAILVVPTPDLDLELWNALLQEAEQERFKHEDVDQDFWEASWRVIYENGRIVHVKNDWRNADGN